MASGVAVAAVGYYCIMHPSHITHNAPPADLVCCGPCRVWCCSVRPSRNAGITRLKLGCRPAAWRNASCRCSGRRASRRPRRSSLLSPWWPTWTTHLKSRAYDRAKDQSGRSRDSLSERFLSLIQVKWSWSGDPVRWPTRRSCDPLDNMAESLFLSAGWAAPTSTLWHQFLFFITK